MIILSSPSTKRNYFSHVWLTHICIRQTWLLLGLSICQSLTTTVSSFQNYMYPHADDHTIWTTIAFINIYLALKSPRHLSHALLSHTLGWLFYLVLKSPRHLSHALGWLFYCDTQYHLLEIDGIISHLLWPAVKSSTYVTTLWQPCKMMVKRSSCEGVSHVVCI